MGASFTGLGNNFFIQVQVAGVSGAGVATGSIALSEGARLIGNFPLDRDGSIYVPCGPNTICDLPRGKYTFVAKYSGDDSFHASSVTIPFEVQQGVLNYAEILNTQTPHVGATVIATVFFYSDPAVTPTGRVTLTRTDTNAVLGSGLVGKNGEAIISFAAPAGQYGVFPAYSGDANYSNGSARFYFNIATSSLAGTTVSIRASSTTATIGGRTGFDIAVAAAPGATALPTGTVTFHTIEGEQTAPENLIGGHLNTFLPWNSAGTVSLYATYNGDANFSSSVSRIVHITITKATPSLALQARSLVVKSGAQTSITAVLTSGLANTVADPPTGTVQFYDNGTPLGTAQALNNGNGGVILATIAPVFSTGRHVITANYSGDSSWNGATASGIAIDVEP